jgi:hypothetical protein
MAQSETRFEEVETPERTLPSGEAAAALLAAGIGSFALGLVTPLAAGSQAISNVLKFAPAAGPLSGKTTVAVVVWLVAWGVLHLLWRNKQVNFVRVFIVSLVFVGLGVLGTFPMFFDLFASH